MRPLFYCCIVSMLFLGCKKESSSKIEIYLLKTFTETLDPAVIPPALSISGAVLEAVPIVADEDIVYYDKSAYIFKLRKDIQPAIKNFGANKAFAVTVDNNPVYFGKFHPGFLSSITFGVATIDPILFNNNELTIQFASIQGTSAQLDKRNDSKLINALKQSRRLR